LIIKGRIASLTKNPDKTIKLIHGIYVNAYNFINAAADKENTGAK
jgi:hypothetical protein